MKRNSELAISSAKNIDIGLGEGNAVLVQLTGNSTPNGTVDFQSTIDGATYTNTPYVQVRSITAAKSVAQLSSITTTTEYVILPPVTQVRISFLANTTGTLDVVWREIDYSPPFDGAFADGDELSFGGVSTIFWEAADADANYLAIEVPTGGGVDVPVVLVGQGLDGQNLALFSGVTQPTLGVIDTDRDTALVLDFSADDAARIRTLGTTRNLTLAPTGALTLAPTTDTIIAAGTGLVMGHTANVPVTSNGSEFQMHGTGYAASTQDIILWGENGYYPGVHVGKSRSTSTGTWGSGTTAAAVHDGDILCGIETYGDDSSSTAYRGARILFIVDIDGSNTTPANKSGDDSRMGSKIAFSTTTYPGSGASAEVVALTIDREQNINLNNNPLLNVGDSGSAWDNTSLRVAVDEFIADGKGLIIGHTARVPFGHLACLSQVVGQGEVDGSFGIGRFSTDTGPALLYFCKSNHGSIGTNVLVADNQNIGEISYYPADGTDFLTRAATFVGQVDDASPTTGDIGMAFVFSQMPGGAGSLTETLRIAANGNVTGTHGDYHVSSDERLKQDVVTITDALAKVTALRGVNFRWKDADKLGTDLKMGLIAQEVEAVVPEVVHTQDNEQAIKSVEYPYLVGLLIEAVKELKAEVDALPKGDK